MSRTLPLVLLLTVVAPAAGQDAGRPFTRIAFGSCADQDKPCPTWDAIAAGKPDLMLLLGDNIYADLEKGKKVTTDVIREKYAILGKTPGFGKVKAACPIMAVWDDHDYGKNDLGAEWELKAESQKIFLDFFGAAADDPRRSRPGVYSAAVFGPPGKRVQVILLDCRYFRSPLKKGPFQKALNTAPYLPNTDPGATFLGDDQWKWLGEQLRQPAEVRLIGTGIQVVADEHPWEKWANIPAERERLFALIRDTKAEGVIFLSGDRHHAELSVDLAAVGYPLYDLTSSGLNQGWKSWKPPERNSHRVGGMPFGDNYGLITIDWDGANPRVYLTARDEFGDVLIGHKVRLSTLKFGAIPVAAGAAPATPLAPGHISSRDALGKVGEEVKVQFVVRSVGTPKGLLLLNSEADFRDKNNFVVTLGGKALAGEWEGATAETFKGKVVRVTGRVKLYRDRPEIEVEDGGQVEVVGK